MDQAEIKTALEKIKNKDPQGFDLLYEKYFRFLFGVAYSVTKSESESYDVIQNVMLRLYELDESLFPTGNELAWLRTVIRNEALMYIRKEKPTVPIDEAFDIPEQDKQITEFVDMDAFNNIIAPLNDKQRQVVSMKILCDMTHKEISKALSMPIGTVQWLYNMSIKKLRHSLTALSALVILLGAGLSGQLISHHNAVIDSERAAEEARKAVIAANEMSISSVDIEQIIENIKPEPVAISPLLIVFAMLFGLSIVSLILFFIFSDRIPTKASRRRIL